MIRLPITRLRDGMVTAQSIYNSEGASYLTRGTKLSQQYIDRLHKLGISGVAITSLDPDMPLPPPEDIIREDTRVTAIHQVYDTYARIQQAKDMEIPPLLSASESIIADLIQKPENLVQMTDIRLYDDYTFAHSVNVAALSAMLAACLRGVPCIGIVTDLPDMLGGSRFSKGMANFVIRCCTGYVLLTEAMNDYLNKKGKPYVILEGHADITMADRIPSLEQKTAPRVCFYAGGVSKQYGLANLVEGFRQADLPNARLDIYGPGDYVEELSKIAEEDPRVFYGGMLLNSEIVAKEQEATLLVNPRPTGEEYVKYSFPSKTMEYMASGTPVLTTVLPGMPKEYHPYVYLLEDETADGIARKLRHVMAVSDEDLFQKGTEARAFVLEQKNNVIQAQKILEMLNR